MLLLKTYFFIQLFILSFCEENENYIIATYNITKNLRPFLINSYEDSYYEKQFNGDSNLPPYILDKENVQDIKDGDIYINGIKSGTIYITFPKEGIYVIKYVFNKAFKSTSCLFSSTETLISIDLSHFNTKKLVYMDDMFSDCPSLRSVNFGNFSTEKVVDMKNMFRNCYNLESLDLSSFNTQNVKDMTEMFSNCKSLSTLDLRNFDMSGVEEKDKMFEGCPAKIVLD